MLESAQPTADELKGVISDALAAGVLTKDDILDMVSTAESPTSASGHTPAGPTIGTDDLPIYTELPEGLIDLPTAARNYGCQLATVLYVGSTRTTQSSRPSPGFLARWRIYRGITDGVGDPHEHG